MRVHPQSDGRVGVTEAICHHVYRDTRHQQGRGVNVPQVMEPTRQKERLPPPKSCGVDGAQGAPERLRRSVRVHGPAKVGREDTAITNPLCPGDFTFCVLVTLLRLEDRDGALVDPDPAFPAALRGPFHPVASDNAGRAPDKNFGLLPVHAVPSQEEQLAAPCAGVGGHPEQRVEPMPGAGLEELPELAGTPYVRRATHRPLWTLRTLNRIAAQNLLGVNGVVERLAQYRMDVL